MSNYISHEHLSASLWDVREGPSRLYPRLREILSDTDAPAWALRTAYNYACLHIPSNAQRIALGRVLLKNPVLRLLLLEDPSLKEFIDNVELMVSSGGETW